MDPRAGIYASDPAIRALFSEIDTVSVYPPYGCGTRGRDVVHHELQLLAARAGTVAANSLVSARSTNDCSITGLFSMAPDVPSGNLVVILGKRYAQTVLEGAGIPVTNCRQRRDIVFCLHEWGESADYAKDLTLLDPAYLTFPAKLEFRREANGTHYLVSGFSQPEDWGVWSTGDKSEIILPLDPGFASPGRLVVSLAGFTPQQRPVQNARVTLQSRQTSGGPWLFEQRQDLRLMPNGTYVLAFERKDHRPVSALRILIEVSQPVSPYELGLGDDRRQLGIALHHIRIE